jgi:hypothetical protein
LVLGIALVIYGVSLFQLSAQTSLIRQVAVATIILDALWVLGSAVILFTDLVALTLVGFWAVAIVADIVAVLAILQFIALRRL